MESGAVDRHLAGPRYFMNSRTRIRGVASLCSGASPAVITVFLRPFAAIETPAVLNMIKPFERRACAEMVDLTGLEPVTFSMSTKRSNQLS